MKAFRTTPLCLLLSLAAYPACAQANRPDAEAVRSSLDEIISLATFGTVAVKDQGAAVTQSGSEYQMLLPLAGFSAPPDAAIKAIARPLGNGLLDIVSMTFPAEGTIQSTPRSGGPSRVTYSIGQQTITAKVDPSLSKPSSYAADLGKVRLFSDRGDQHSEQTLDRYITDGTLSADAAGRLAFASQGHGTNLHLTGHGANGLTSDANVRAVAGHFSLEGLDRGQGERLLSAARGFAADAKTPDQPASPGQPPRPADMSPAERHDLRAMIEAAPGLLNRFDAEEVMQEVRFSTGAGNGTIRRLSLKMTGDAADQRLNTQLDVAMDGISTSALPAATAAYVPHHLDLKTILTGVKIGPLLALLRAATEPGISPAALQAQAMALLADPRARLAIDSLAFDSGPLRVTGSARSVPHADGQPGVEIHISAGGMDELLAQTRGDPNLQRFLPMVFIAKGMGHQQGDSLVWDIRLGDGPLTVNGIPFGQSSAKTR